MQKNPGHQPKRFEVYTQLPNGSGFKIQGSNHIFLYDRHGGWKDQYGNYYNSDCQPDQQPDTESEKSISQGNWQSDEDQYEKQFGPSNQVQEEFQKQPVNSQIQQTIAKNIAELEHHIQRQPLRIDFQILDVDHEQDLPTINQLITSYRKKIKGVLNAFYDDKAQQQQNFVKTGYFVLGNVAQATKLIHLQGQNIAGYDVSFDVQTFQQLRNDPLSEKELEDPIPKFVDVSQTQKLYTLCYQNGQGFSCDKKTFNAWIKGLKLSNSQIVKMKKNEKKQKMPILKLNQAQLNRISQTPLDGHKVIANLYIPKSHHHHQQEKQTEQKKVEETNVSQKKQEEKKTQ